MIVIADLPEITLTEALKLMFEHNIGALPVANERSGFIGIVSKGDVTAIQGSRYPRMHFIQE